MVNYFSGCGLDFGHKKFTVSPIDAAAMCMNGDCDNPKYRLERCLTISYVQKKVAATQNTII